VPHFIECLGDVKKCSGEILFVFEGFVYPLDDKVGLFYCGMSLSEAELASGVHQWEDTVYKYIFENFGYNGVEAYGAVGC
jgi:hypothetical protein